MKISEAFLESTKTRDSARFQRLCNQWVSKGRDILALPLVLDVNRAGYDGHRWAWDQVEVWQDS